MNENEKRDKLEELTKRKEKLAKQIAAIKKAAEQSERKADAHLKIVLGAYYLKMIESDKVTPESAINILSAIDSGVEKVGVARDRFEAIKAKKLAQLEAKRAQPVQAIQRPNVSGTAQTNVSN